MIQDYYPAYNQQQVGTGPSQDRQGKISGVPIDPQMTVKTQFGLQSVPAQAVLDQFDLAKNECSNPANMGSWLPILSQYGPALLVQCHNALTLSQQLVSEWLESYMFSAREDANEISKEIAAILANHTEFRSHGRHINREKAEGYGLTK